jgi:hypothetical protein
VLFQEPTLAKTPRPRRTGDSATPYNPHPHSPFSLLGFPIAQSPQLPSCLIAQSLNSLWDWPFTQVGNWQRSINAFQLLLFAVVAKPLNSSIERRRRRIWRMGQMSLVG